MAICISKNGIPIRLPEERWQHICQRHSDIEDKKELILDAVKNPARIVAGNHGALMALQELELGKWLVVIYKEDRDDGFVITAFATRRLNQLNRRRQVWP